MEKEPNGRDSAEQSASPPQVRHVDVRLQKHVDEQLRRHKDIFVQPTPEFLRTKLEIFQIDRTKIVGLPPVIVCGLERKLKFHPTKKFDPGIYEVGPFVHRVTPKSLDHLKQLSGVPNDVYVAMRKRNLGCGEGPRLRPVDMRYLPADKAIHFDRLSAEQRIAVRDLSFNLLMGYADPGATRKQPYAAVVEYMLKRVVEVPTFVGKDLLVCPDETVEFSGFAAVYFDNVIAVGNGKIVLGDSTKLHAYQIKHA